MNSPQLFRRSMVLALAGFGTSLSQGRTFAQQQTWTGDEAGVQVLTRGPVHEAFAETITFDPEPGFVVTTTPPAAIEELPPDQIPDGVNVDWVPGYWAWDDERGDFVWISGVWRDLPPGREWVPGYWGNTNRGYQWTSGYWADAQAGEIEYLPEPPGTVEIGPNIAAPSVDHSWMPGCWVWYEGRYAWRPGYWVAVQPDWVWTPAHYVWTPGGYVFVDGYWDYVVSRRGVLYAPVYFEPAVYARRDFVYSPVTVINTYVFVDHLFVRPQYNHYYFGDYYDNSYRESGFFASFSFHSGRRGYDPIYAHERWTHRRDSDWDHHVQSRFDQRRDHEDFRPRRTLAAQISYSKTDARRADRSFTLASSFEQFSRNNKDGVSFRRVGDDARKQVSQRGKEVQRFREERQRVEVDASSRKVSNRSEPIRMKSQRSPIAAKPGNQLGKGRNPPARPEAPQPDPKVERKSRKTVEKRDRQEKK